MSGEAILYWLSRFAPSQSVDIPLHDCTVRAYFPTPVSALWISSPLLSLVIFSISRKIFFRFPQSERLEQTREKSLQKISCPSSLPSTENLLKDSQGLRLSSGFLLRRITFEAQQIEVPPKRFLRVLFLMAFHRRPDTVVSLYMYWLRKQHNNSAFLVYFLLHYFVLPLQNVSFTYYREKLTTDKNTKIVTLEISQYACFSSFSTDRNSSIN